VSPDWGSGREFLLDSTVYIDTLQGRSPAEVDEVLRQPRSHHSAVTLGELTQAFGRLDPADPRTAAALRKIAKALSGIPPRRLSAPSVRAFAEAGMLAGLAARLRAADSGPALLNDALLLLHARETGRIVLTRNVRDFDVLQQLAPDTEVAFYRTT
jgi:predicted nucleic acid-binding protein